MNIMAKAVNVSLRIDEDVKRESEQLFGELGLTLSAAVNVFLRQAIRHGGLPFDVKVGVPGRDTMEAVEEVQGNLPNALRGECQSRRGVHETRRQGTHREGPEPGHQVGSI